MVSVKLLLHFKTVFYKNSLLTLHYSSLINKYLPRKKKQISWNTGEYIMCQWQKIRLFTHSKRAIVYLTNWPCLLFCFVFSHQFVKELLMIVFLTCSFKCSFTVGCFWWHTNLQAVNFSWQIICTISLVTVEFLLRF